MSEMLFEAPGIAAAPLPEPIKWTERALLDLLDRRLSAVKNGMSRRHIAAEQVRYDPGAGANTYVADAISIDCWRSGDYALSGYEVKCSRSDWLRELKSEKWRVWSAHCTYWWLIAPREVVRDDLPPEWGHLAPVGNSLRVIRHAPRLDAQPLPLSSMAGLVRATANTARRVTTDTTTEAS